MARSYLFVPGHQPEMIAKADRSLADEIIIDLEDAVPPADKEAARRHAASHLAAGRGWLRINRAATALAERDLEVCGSVAARIRIPKVESPDDVSWVRRRASHARLMCAIESARGLAEAVAIASTDGVSTLALGAVDLRADLGVDDSHEPLAHARSVLVLASRAAHLEDGPIDSVHTRIPDLDGLAAECRIARRFGFRGKSAIHPHQLTVIHEEFAPSIEDIAWARRVIDVFESSAGAATQTPEGEFVDLPVVKRARAVLAGAPEPS